MTHPPFPCLIRKAVLTAFIGFMGAVCAQVAPLHHWVGFSDKVGCGVDLNSPSAGSLLLSPRHWSAGKDKASAWTHWTYRCRLHRIAEVLAAGATEQGPSLALLHRSKWFNGIVIQTGYCPARLSRNRRRSRQHRPTGWRLRSQARSVVPRCGPSSSRAQKPRGACCPVRKWARTLRGCVAPSAPVKSGPDSRIGSQGSGDDGRCVGQWIRPGRHQPRL